MKQYPSRNLLLLLTPFALLVGACTDDDGGRAGFTRATATIENKLPSDGCSYPITIDGVQYAADAASFDAVVERVGSSSSVTVEVEYRITGQTGSVTCERGSSARPEIDVEFP